MKKYILFALLVIGLYLVYLNKLPFKKSESEKTKGLNQVAGVDQKLPLVGERYAYSIIKIDNNLKLFSNLEMKMTSEELKEDYDCNSLVNAGFYDENDKHIGLFVSKGEVVSKRESNKLLNGYVFIDNGSVEITKEYLENFQYALQTGPVIMANNKMVNPDALDNEKLGRRILMAKDKSDNVYFIAIFDPNAYFSGPSLSEIPKLVNQISEKSDIDFANIINLDGGTASAVKSKDFQLNELVPIGGFFCEEK